MDFADPNVDVYELTAQSGYSCRRTAAPFKFETSTPVTSNASSSFPPRALTARVRSRCRRGSCSLSTARSLPRSEPAAKSSQSILNPRPWCGAGRRRRVPDLRRVAKSIYQPHVGDPKEKWTPCPLGLGPSRLNRTWCLQRKTRCPLESTESRQERTPCLLRRAPGRPG